MRTDGRVSGVVRVRLLQILHVSLMAGGGCSSGRGEECLSRFLWKKGELVWSELSIFVDFCRFFWDIFTKIPQNNEKGTTEKSQSNEHRKKGTPTLQRALHTAGAPAKKKIGRR